MKRTRSTSGVPTKLTEPPQHLGTGRPARKASTRSPLPPGFVDSTEALENLSDEDSSDENSDDDEETPSNPRKKLSTRHQRPVSPARSLSPPEPLDDLPVNLSEPIQSPSSLSTHPKTLSLTIQIPPGHVGDLVVNLDLAALTSPGQIPPTPAIIDARSASVCGPDSPTPQGLTSRPGFLSLPAELRNIIYRLVFVTPETIKLNRPGNWSRTAALLSSCRQIHREGAAILYGENKYKIERESRFRGAFYDDTWKEVGYKDCWRFLSTIGPVNVSLIRDLHIQFEDGAGHLPYDDTRRFVYDEYIMQCLKVIGHCGRLQKLAIGFMGKRKLTPSDQPFLSHLFLMKADTVAFYDRYGGFYRHQSDRPYRFWGGRNSKLEWGMEDLIHGQIERDQKLY